jgi:hypothetical protein
MELEGLLPVTDLPLRAARLYGAIRAELEVNGPMIASELGSLTNWPHAVRSKSDLVCRFSG